MARIRLATAWGRCGRTSAAAGIVAEYNLASSGAYKRTLDKNHNIVAFMQPFEEVTMTGGIYSVVRKSDNQTLNASTLVTLRNSHFAACCFRYPK